MHKKYLRSPSRKIRVEDLELLADRRELSQSSLQNLKDSRTPFNKQPTQYCFSKTASESSSFQLKIISYIRTDEH